MMGISFFNGNVRGVFKLLLCNIIVILFFICNPLKAQVYINEIMVNPSGANDGANMPNTSEWIELYNGSSSSVNIGCWVITDGDFAVTFPSGTSISAGGFYTIASATGSGLSPNLDWATCGCTTNNPAANGSLSGNQVGILTNGAEQVLLYNSSNIIEDAVIWGGGQFPAGALTPTVNAFGSCISRTLSIPSTTLGIYENIGTSLDGVAKERDYDGSVSWQNTVTHSFGISNGVNPLPISLISFIANLKNKYVELNWITAMETNNDYFTIERSINGIVFEEVSNVYSKGNSNEVLNYSISDFNPYDGISYYRLKQTDLDGNYTYSNIVSVENSIKIIIDVYPNPTIDGKIHILINNETHCSLEIFDSAGNLLQKKTLNSVSSEVNISSYDSGVYLFILSTNETKIIKKIIYSK